MISKTTPAVDFSRPSFCPPPLHIQKKSRKATIKRRILRKPTPKQRSYTLLRGPLDDIINEIQCDIWDSPPSSGWEPSVHDFSWTNHKPAHCCNESLLVSYTPSERPLRVRKNRVSRSSTSGASMDPARLSSRDNNGKGRSSNYSGTTHNSSATVWPTLGENVCSKHSDVLPHADGIHGAEDDSTQQSLHTVVRELPLEAPKQRRPSRLRQLTNRFMRPRHSSTEGHNMEGPAADSVATTNTTSLQAATQQDTDVPSDDAVEAYVRKNAHDSHKVGNVVSRVAQRLPATGEPEEEILEGMPTILKAAVTIFSENMILEEPINKFSVVVEVEAVLHNRNTLRDASADYVFIIDNGYYVTADCLTTSVRAINTAMNSFRSGDRVALYTTHCTHIPVSGNLPEEWYPIRPFTKETEGAIRTLSKDICKLGTQSWLPPRPNPTMTDVVLGVAKSLDADEVKKGRTHMVLLSPAACVLHNVSKTFPDLFIHRVNPAVLAVRRDPDMGDTVCLEDCCKNISTSNWNSYQSIHHCIKRIVGNTRFKAPVGELTNIAIEPHTMDGVKILQRMGNTTIPKLRLGQVYTVLLDVQVDKDQTRAVGLDSADPFFNSSLEAKNLRQDLQNSAVKGATKVHLLRIKLLYHNTIHAVQDWNYSETQLIVTRELGGLRRPFEPRTDVYFRRFFHHFSRLPLQDAITNVKSLLAETWGTDRPDTGFLQRIEAALCHHNSVLEYEANARQKLPTCFAEVLVAYPHDHLQNFWEMTDPNRARHQDMSSHSDERLLA